MIATQIHTLKNGLRIVHTEVDRPVAHCGLFISAGTRDELDDESGLAHFIEHAIFKGTKKRKAFHILNRLDSVGGEVDAYTTKELTCFYASFLHRYYDRAIELISDITFNSQFPEKELDKEREVILDEINVYKDSPSEQIYDDFEGQVFAKHALGKPILGTEESVKKLKRNQFLGYTHRLYQPSNMVFTSVGNIPFKKLIQRLEKYFGETKNDSIVKNRKAFHPQKGSNIIQELGTNQSHCMFGKAVYGLEHPNRLGLILLNNLFGGPAMNSILNLKIREKYGFTYNIESNYSVYSDTGLFSIYIGTDPKNLDACLSAVHKELKLLRERPLGSQKLHLAKQQLKGQMAIARESNTNRMLAQGKSLLLRNKIQSWEEIHQKIDRIGATDLQEIANEHMNPEDYDYLIFQG